MQYEVALVPVLAGYWVLKRTHLLKHAYSRQSDYRAFFDPAVTGGTLLAASWILIRAASYSVDHNESLASFVALVKSVLPTFVVDLAANLLPLFDHAPVLVGTILLALSIPLAANLWWGEDTAGNRWALENETAKGRLLRESLEEGSLVEVSSSNGRSVIGWATTDTAPHHGLEGHVSLSPQLSGYRDPQTHKLVITAEYANTGDDFRIVLLVEDTATVSHFDPESPYTEWRIPGINV